MIYLNANTARSTATIVYTVGTLPGYHLWSYSFATPKQSLPAMLAILPREQLLISTP